MKAFNSHSPLKAHKIKNISHLSYRKLSSNNKLFLINKTKNPASFQKRDSLIFRCLLN